MKVVKLTLLFWGRLDRGQGRLREDLPRQGERCEPSWAERIDIPDLLLLGVVQRLFELVGELLLEVLNLFALLARQVELVADEEREEIVAALSAVTARTARISHDGVRVLPDNLFIRGHLEDCAAGARADERIPIG